MSAETIIKNIFQFAQVLNDASGENVCHWNSKSLQNALNWADYCQEIYRQVKGKEYEAGVNRQLEEMTMFLEPVSCLRFSVECLGNSKYLLVETLMTNPKFPGTSQEILQNLIKAKADGAIIMQQLQKETCFKIYQDLVSFICIKQEDEKAKDKIIEHESSYQAKALLHHLAKTAHAATKVQRFKKYCQAVYDKLAESQKGLAILVYLFCVKVKDVPQEIEVKLPQLLTYAADCLQQKIEQDVEQSSLWNLKPEILCRAAIGNENFFKLYLNSLVSWADCFAPGIQDKCNCTWRSSHGHDVVDLAHHFQCFLRLSNAKEDIKTHVLKMITDKVHSTGFSVWQVIAKTILDSFRQS